MVERIEVLALEHPAFGCNRPEAMLALEGVRVTWVTIRRSCMLAFESASDPSETGDELGMKTGPARARRDGHRDRI